MLFAFLVTVREGFEIALILAIVLGYLGRTGNRAAFRQVWAGTALAVALTVAVVVVLRATASELSGGAQEVFEGAVMLGAAGVLTWMVVWMRRQAVSLGRELRAQVDVAVARGSVLALASLAFSSVAREGIAGALTAVVTTGRPHRAVSRRRLLDRDMTTEAVIVPLAGAGGIIDHVLALQILDPGSDA